MSVRDDLIKARALIDTPEKWCQGAYECNGGLCVLGASRVAVFGEVTKGHDQNRVADALYAVLDPAWLYQIDTFNDHPDTTHADVMALFDRAIAAEEARETA